MCLLFSSVSAFFLLFSIRLLCYPIIGIERRRNARKIILNIKLILVLVKLSIFDTICSRSLKWNKNVILYVIYKF